MKKIDLGQAITTGANIGVIAGIVFLAVELQQNNELQALELRLAAEERSRTFSLNLSQNSALAEVMAKAEQDQPLTRAEEIQLYGLGLTVIRSWRFQYEEMARGGSEVNVDGWRQVWHDNFLDYNLEETWEKVKSRMSPEFVQYVEEQVVDWRP